MTNHVPLPLQITLFLKTKRGKQHLLQIILVEQLRIMSFNEVQDFIDKVCKISVLRISDTFTFIFAVFSSKNHMSVG